MRWRDGPQGRQVTFLPLAQEVARLRGPTCPRDLLACPHVNLPEHQWLSQALGQTWAQQDPQGQVLWALSGAIGPGALLSPWSSALVCRGQALPQVCGDE